MKDNPLVEALQKKGPEIHFDSTPSRTIEVHHSEIPGLPEMKPGEHVTVSVQGHVSSHGNGISTLQVHHIAPESVASGSETETMRVIPPNSPVPS